MQLPACFRSFLAFLLCLTLVACGGGSGPSAGGAEAPVVSGSAAKGFLIGADVTLYAVEKGKRGNVLARTVTDEGGNYRFDGLGTLAGPALIEVVSNDKTMMVDELNGLTRAPVGLVLRAAVPDIAKTREIHLTPFSEMAAAAAEAAASLSPGAIEAANRGVAKDYLGGIDLLGTRPLRMEDFSSSAATEEERALTKALLAVAVAADQKEAAGADNRKCAQAEYADRVRCTVKGMAVAAAATGSAGNLAVLGRAMARIQRGEVEFKGSEGSLVGFALQRPSFSQEQRFGQIYGTWSGTWTRAQGGALPALSTTAERVAAVRKMFDDLVLQSASAAIKNTAWDIAEDDFHLAGSARGVKFLSMLIKALRIAQDDSAGASLAGTQCARLAAGTVRCVGVWSFFSHGHYDLELVVTRSGDTFQWTARQIVTGCQTSADGRYSCNTGPYPDEFKGGGKLVAASGQLQSFSAQGKMPWDGGRDGGDELNVQVDLSKAYGAQAALSGAVGITGRWVLYEPYPLTPAEIRRSRTIAITLEPGSTLAYGEAGSIREARLLIQAAAGDEVRLSGQLSYRDFVVWPRNGNDDYHPLKYGFRGEVKTSGTVASSFSGEVMLGFPGLRRFDPTQPHSAENFPAAQRAIAAKVDNGDGFPFTLTEMRRQEAPQRETTTASFEFQGGRVLEVSAMYDEQRKEASLTLSNPEGVRFTLSGKDDAPRGEVVYRDTLLGSLNISTKALVFIDGTSLSLSSLFGSAASSR